MHPREVKIMMRALSTVLFVLAIAVAVVASFAAEEPAKEKGPSAITTAFSQLEALQTTAARDTLEKARPELGSTPEFQAAWALLEFQEGDAAKAKKAVDAISQTAKNQASHPIPLYYQGEMLYQQQKTQQASEAWKSAAKAAAAAVAKAPTDATAQYYLGAALVRQKDFKGALEALQTAARGGFDEAMVNHQIGLIYLFQQKWQEAKKAFDLGLEADPRFAPIYYWRGLTWQKLNRKDNMLLDLDQYVKLAPNGPEAGKAKAILKSVS
jgi:tetratricopeptide (TPR) repeat protein